jgi:hypothetical protein
MKPDPLDELGNRLFEVAREERPSDELRARLLGARSGDERPAMAVPETISSEPRARGPRLHRTATRWLLLAASLGTAALVFQQWHGQREGRLLSPEERMPTTSRARAENTVELARPAVPVESPQKPAPAAVPSLPKRTVAPSVPHRESVDRGSPNPAQSAPKAVPHATLAEELEWLTRVRALLRSGDSGGALLLLDAYTSELGGSDLNAEASVLRMEALSAAGRHDEAAALAERFVADNPNSPLVDRALSFFRRSGEASPRQKSSAP